MKTIKLSFLLILVSTSVFSQVNWFRLYPDSLSITKDGNIISTLFKEDVHKINSQIVFDVETVLNTTPGLIYYYNKTVNLPLWEQVIPELKMFLYDLAGSEADGKRVFELYFNGFYLPHELAHALQDSKEGGLTGSYQNEYFANTVAMLWWKKHGNSSELAECYKYAKQMLLKLSDPTPKGRTKEEYFTSNYEEAAQNPYNYGFLQFSQFVAIYEDTNLPDFDTYITNYLHN